MRVYECPAASSSCALMPGLSHFVSLYACETNTHLPAAMLPSGGFYTCRLPQLPSAPPLPRGTHALCCPQLIGKDPEHVLKSTPYRGVLSG